MTEDVLLRAPDDQVRRVAEFTRHAEALAERLERLPSTEGRDLQAARQERLRSLRWAVTAGTTWLQGRTAG